MSNAISPLSSPSGFIFQKTGYLLTTKDADKLLPRIAKIGAGCVAFPLLALISAVEVVVRGILTILAKLVHFFMAKDADTTRMFEATTLNPLLESTLIVGWMMMMFGSIPLLNFMKKGSKNNFTNSLFTAAIGLNKIISESALHNLHINGVYKPQTA